MKVELKEHVGTLCGTSKPQKLDQFRIFVDGYAVGYIGFSPKSNVVLTRRFSDEERAEIERKVSAEVKRRVSSVQAPEIPEDYDEQTEVDIDDFD